MPKSDLKDSFIDDLKGKRREKAAAIIAKNQFYWKGNGIFFGAWVTSFLLIIAFFGAESGRKTDPENYPHLFLGFLIGFVIRQIYFFAKSQRIKNLPVETVKKMWLELGGLK